MFYEKAANNFLNSEQRIIYEEKTANNFLNNAEQNIILCKILEIVYVENSEKFSWENSEQFYLMQKIILLSEQFYIQLIRTFLQIRIFRHLPLGDLYESFIFISWSLSIIHMVTYFKKHKNHLSAIIAPMLKTVYAKNSEQFLWETNE